MLLDVYSVKMNKFVKYQEYKQGRPFEFIYKVNI